jgi:hypothetical protein
MSIPRAAQLAKLVIGLFTPDKPLWQRAVIELNHIFGGLDLISGWFPFDYTRYYEAEMGGPLFRRMVAFKQLIAQERLADIKLTTTRLEDDYHTGSGRSINIDPGYLLKERFVLATAKNFSHRIYIGQGIYADLALVYQDGGFRALPWTYPDYRSHDILSFLTKVRCKYVRDLRQEETAC